MSPVSRNSKYAFLTVSEVTDNVYCGGLLILGCSGRPLEFHCTTPVMANRAQQILYGATLREFVVCDQIANELLKKSSSKPSVILVDQPELSSVKNLTPIPLVLVLDNQSQSMVGAQHEAIYREIEQQPIQMHVDLKSSEEIESMLKLFVETLPLTEPFERIYQAIGEAQKEAA